MFTFKGTTGLLKRGDSERLIWTALSIVCLAVLSLYIYLFCYINPQLDDYDNTLILNSRGFWGYIKHWYLNWTGRYTAIGIFAVLNPYKNGSLIWYRISTFLIFSFLCISIFFFWNCVINNVLNKKAAFIASLITITVFVFNLPEPTTIYWFSSSVTYTSGIGLTLFFSGSLIMYYKSRSKAWMIITILSALALTGTNEIHAFALLTFYYALITFKLLKRIHIHKYEWVLLVFISIALLISFLAPGNFIRNDKLSLHYNNTFDFKWALEKGIYHTALQYWFGLKNIPLLCASLLTLPYLNIITKKSEAVFNIKFPHPLIALATGVIFYFILFFLFLFVFGYVPIQRNISAYWPFFMISWIYFLLCLSRKINIKSIHMIKKRGIKISAAIIFIFGLFLPWSQINCTINTLYSGDAYYYNIEVSKRLDFLEAVSKKKYKGLILLPELKHQPKQILNNDLSINSQYYYNKSLSQYYNLDSIAIIKKPEKK